MARKDANIVGSEGTRMIRFGKIFAITALSAVMSLSACNTTGGNEKGPDGKTVEKEAKKRNKRSGSRERNPGPCPRAFALYDAARIVNFEGERQAFANVGFTAEVTAVKSLCRYFDDRPIDANVTIEFDAGRGPAAQGNVHVYNMFLAVTRTNTAVIEKVEFPITVRFPDGADRVEVRETIDKIIIPRASDTTSGSNFEIVVGFVIDEQQRDFNAQGKRFRPTAGKNK